MVSKRSWIVILVGVNLLLLALLVIGSYSLPKAFAQSGGRAGDFVCVTAKTSGQNFDVVYILDRPAGRLHAFYSDNPQSRKYVHAQFRDLKKDFGN